MLHHVRGPPLRIQKRWCYFLLLLPARNSLCQFPELVYSINVHGHGNGHGTNLDMDMDMDMNTDTDKEMVTEPDRDTDKNND
jgi:hypothetical protein